MKGLMDGFFIGDSGILARLFRPHGPARCPLVVIFHGFPGIELNYDIAYALRDAGCAALVPHYAGSWGSKGDFRVDRLADTVATVLKHARSEPFAKRYGIDPGPLRVAGPLPPAKPFESQTRFLSGVTAEQLVAGFVDFYAKWSPFRSIETLGSRFFMLLAASEPGPVSLPLEPAVELARKAQTQNPEAELWVLASDHSFVSQREVLRGLVVEFITGKL